MRKFVLAEIACLEQTAIERAVVLLFLCGDAVLRSVCCGCEALSNPESSLRAERSYKLVGRENIVEWKQH